mgnify:CR=1 FL=1
MISNLKSGQTELVVSQVTPITQIAPTYNFTDFLINLDTGGGNFTNEDNMYFVMDSGVQPTSLSLALTSEYTNIKAGQSGAVIFDAIFDTPQLGNLQAAGFANSENLTGFGYYLDNDFGIVYATGGRIESQELVITTPASSPETSLVTINGIEYPINLTAGTTDHNAFEIFIQLKALIGNMYLLENIDNTVKVVAKISQVLGAFNFVSSTCVANFTQLSVGSDLNYSFTPYYDFNVTTLDNFDEFKINEFKIVVDGNINYYIKDPDTGFFELVHVLKNLSYSESPVFENKYLRGGWFNRNIDNQTGVNVQLRGTKCGTFIEGVSLIEKRFKSFTSVATGISSAVNEAVGHIKVRTEFDGIINRVKVYLSKISIATTANKSVTFVLRKNAVYTDEVIFNYINKQGSFVTYSEDKVVVSGGDIIGSFTISANGSGIIELKDLTNNLIAEDTLSIEIISDANSAHEVTYSLIWQEDI